MGWRNSKIFDSALRKVIVSSHKAQIGLVTLIIAGKCMHLLDIDFDQMRVDTLRYTNDQCGWVYI